MHPQTFEIPAIHGFVPMLPLLADGDDIKSNPPPKPKKKVAKKKVAAKKAPAKKAPAKKAPAKKKKK